MKLPVAYGLSVIMVLSFIILRHHALINYLNISNKIKKEHVTQIHEYDSVARQSVAHDEIVNLKEFVFFDTKKLLNFEDNKKKRARCLLEQLCGAKRTMNIQCNLLFTRMPLRAIAMRNHLSIQNKQSFGVPQVVGKNTLVKKIAITQLAEKNMLPKKECMISALARLLE